MNDIQKAIDELYKVSENEVVVPETMYTITATELKSLLEQVAKEQSRKAYKIWRDAKYDNEVGEELISASLVTDNLTFNED